MIYIILYLLAVALLLAWNYGAHRKPTPDDAFAAYRRHVLGCPACAVDPRTCLVARLHKRDATRRMVTRYQERRGA